MARHDSAVSVAAIRIPARGPIRSTRRPAGVDVTAQMTWKIAIASPTAEPPSWICDARLATRNAGSTAATIRAGPATRARHARGRQHQAARELRHRLRATRRARGRRRAKPANSAVVSACGPSLSASAGFGWTSTIRPSAPAATAARLSGSHELAPPGRVARVDDHGQVRALLEHRHGREVERVPRRALERADAALAQRHVVVALAEDVLGGEQQLVDRRRRRRA